MECNISDPCVHIDLENLPDYSKNHLLQWLIFRGDSLQRVYSLKDAKSRVLGYFDNKTVDHLVDPTLDLKWKCFKAESLGYTLKLSQQVDVSIPNELCMEINSMKSLDGWAKTLGDIPTSFSHEHIVRYHKEINKMYASSSTLIKKNVVVNYLKRSIYLHSVHAKEDNDVYAVEGLCAANLRQVDRWVIFVLKKRHCQVYFAYCQCTAFALMKMVSKWHVHLNLSWSIPQSRGRVTKIPEMNVIATCTDRYRCR